MNRLAAWHIPGLLSAWVAFAAIAANPSLLWSLQIADSSSPSNSGELEQASEGESQSAVATSSNERVDFSLHIRPILSDNCFKCHGPDPHERHADLRLDIDEDWEDRMAVVPGDPESSAVFWRIIAGEDEGRMPPPDSNRGKLSDEDIDLIRRWIEQGAEWAEHWSFVPLQPVPLPEVEYQSWAQTPIDLFVLAELERRGLRPSPPADPRTLARRISFDLTGLPPTSEQVEALVADPSPENLERYIDELMASPRYGEHMARYWLDAARYGDTHGLHLDNYREMWPYRDWVIDAFNRNMPFHDFLIEQLAGDLLDDPTEEQLIATGFNRAHVTTNEGGAIEDEVLMRNIRDRVDTTGIIMMGLTVGCASCHDHKYDPISQREYYQLYAFFNSLDGNPMDGNVKDHAPVLRVPDDQQREELAVIDDSIAEVRRQIAEHLAQIRYEVPVTDAPPRPPIIEPREIVWIDDDLPPGAQPYPAWEYVTADQGPVYSGVRASTRTAEGLSQHIFERASPPLVVAQGDVLFAHVWLDADNPPRQIMLQWNDGTWDHRAYWGEDLIPWGQPDTSSRRRIGDLPPAGQWVRLEVPADTVSLDPGARIHGWAFTQYDGTVYWDAAGVVTSGPAARQFRHLGEWIALLKREPKDQWPQSLREILEKDSDQWCEEQRREVTEYFVEHVWQESRDRFAPLHERLRESEGQRRLLTDQIPTTLVWRELSDPREAHILLRGEYDHLGEVVPRDVPAALPPLESDGTPDRLALAHWFTSPEHPLTSRVAANRFWQQVFGSGIVLTADDFGAQGEMPSHPEMLNWLAYHWMQEGWDVQWLMKTMVMSATYQQASRVSPELLAIDPDNRLLARGPRFRMDAEMLRDQALALSGLLVEQLGGPGVKPPQPSGVWEAVAYVGSNTMNYEPDTEPEKVHRRSLYIFLKRTAPPPQLATFDAPNRESCTVRRERTNTPLQALVLMNEAQYVESARHLAQQVLQQDLEDDAARAAWLIEQVTLRPAREFEVDLMLDLLDANRAEFEQDQQAAEKLVAIGNRPAPDDIDRTTLAAWTTIGNLLLNLDEVLNK